MINRPDLLAAILLVAVMAAYALPIAINAFTSIVSMR
jgi:hypothetical protein